MKKAMGIIILGLLLSGCATTSSNLEKGNIQIGMSKKEFCYQATSLNAKKNTCSLTWKEMYDKKPRGIYYPETNMEIMHDFYMESFFVFENVTIPYDWFDPYESAWVSGPEDIKGDGTLVKIFKNFDEAKNFASGKEFSVGTDKVQQAKQACENLGFETGTEEFAECSLKKLKEQSQ
jgi:hypothetical protein